MASLNQNQQTAEQRAGLYTSGSFIASGNEEKTYFYSGKISGKLKQSQTT